MNRKIEYSNQLKIISDSKTISIIKLTCLEGLLQVTNKLIRLIRSKNKNIKIYHWKSKTPILKFIHNFHENSYILLLLSNNRIVLIEFINDDLFIELKSWNLEKFDKSLLIMKCYISSIVYSVGHALVSVLFLVSKMFPCILQYGHPSMFV